MFFDKTMKKQFVLYSYNEILLNNKNEPTTDTCYNMNASQKHYAE